jgi:hypothetical protein
VKPVVRTTFWKRVLAAASALPEVEESTSYGTAALKVRGKLFARLKEDGSTLVVRVGDEREALILAAPKTFFVTAHYENYPWVLVDLNVVTPEVLRDVVTAAWLLQAPKRLAAQLTAPQVDAVSPDARSSRRTQAPPAKRKRPRSS